MRLFLIFLFSCSAAWAESRPLVVATHTVLADMTRAIAGPEVDVHCLVGVGIDPHAYEPRPADVRLLARAALVVENGLGLEPWAGRLITSSGFKGPVFQAADGIPYPLLGSGHAHAHTGADEHHDHDHGHGEPIDPHAWHDVRNAEHYARGLTKALADAFPHLSDAIQQRGRAYGDELKSLHAYAESALGGLPPERRKLVTAHDSLGYLGRAYGLTIVPLAGTRPDQEPGAGELANLIKTIRRERVGAVFFEATSNPKLACLVAEEAGVAVLRQLHTDSLGPPDTPAATYTGMVRANVDIIAAALR